jgi:hypothetical protein
VSVSLATLVEGKTVLSIKEKQEKEEENHEHKIGFLQDGCLDGPEGFPKKEEMRAYYYNLIQLSAFEIAWNSQRHGQLADDYFASWKS